MKKISKLKTQKSKLKEKLKTTNKNLKIKKSKIVKKVSKVSSFATSYVKVSKVKKASEDKSKASKAVKSSKPDKKSVTQKAQSKLSVASDKLSNLSVAKKSSKVPQTRTSSVRGEPHTMEELLKITGYQLKGLKRGQKVEGIITSISGKVILVDIGAKTEGVVLSKEMEESAELIKHLKVGEKLKAYIYSPENDKGQILLSIKQAAMDYKWDALDKYLKTGEAVEVRGLEINRGGLIARFMDIRGFIPASQFGHIYLGKLDTLQNRVIKVKVIEVDREKNRLIFSEKEISEALALAQKQQALKKVKTGQTYDGVVSGIMPFGIFVRVEIDPSIKGEQGMFLEGLVHISEISWERVEDLNKLFKVGDKLKVKVSGLDAGGTKLNLSIKQLGIDPWMEMIKKYPLEKKVKGEVIRLASFGAFVALEPGIEGLIHISKIPADYEIKVGKKIDVFVEAVEPDKRRMSLGLVLTEKPVGYK